MTDLIEKARFLASGQDDPHSVALSECADALAAQAAEIERLTKERDCAKSRADVLMADATAATTALMEAEIAIVTGPLKAIRAALHPKAPAPAGEGGGS